jgi:4-hydroxy-tetrahydrodipicolinate reductase
MTKVIIVGACGKMSGALISSLASVNDIMIIGGIEAAGHPNIGMPIGKGYIQAGLSSIINDADTVIEFAIPEVTAGNIKIASENNKPYIVGTTGITDLEQIKTYTKNIPILISSNFSLGVNLLFQLAGDAAKTLRDFDIDIIEAHHKMKRDAPSGTAKKLVEVINKAQMEVRLPPNKNTRKSNFQINVHSIRAGDIVGDHAVIFTGQGERVEITHRATSRNAFASGVIQAIRFIVSQKPGLYTMEDITRLASESKRVDNK